MANDIVNYQDVITDIKGIISYGQEAAYNAANKAMVFTYWHVGKRIVEQEQAGKERAKYGQALIEALADEQIVNACVHNLNWTHFRALLRVPDENSRLWYMNEAAQEGWSSRTLDRNISTQYYYRLMQSPKKDAVIKEMLQKTEEKQKNKFELLKSSIVAEFLGFKNEDSYIESDLESAILTHIRDFLMEMGKGFAFVARQQHIVTETEDLCRNISHICQQRSS